MFAEPTRGTRCVGLRLAPITPMVRSNRFTLSPLWLRSRPLGWPVHRPVSSVALLLGWLDAGATQSWSPSPSAAMKTVAAIIVAESSCAHPKALVAATPVAAPMCTCNSKRPSKALAPPFASVPFVFEYHSFIHASILLMELAHMFTQHLSRLAGCMRAGFQAHGSVASHRLAEKRIPWAARPADRGTPLKAHLLPTGRA